VRDHPLGVLFRPVHPAKSLKDAGATPLPEVSLQAVLPYGGVATVDGLLPTGGQAHKQRAFAMGLAAPGLPAARLSAGVSARLKPGGYGLSNRAK